MMKKRFFNLRSMMAYALLAFAAMIMISCEQDEETSQSQKPGSIKFSVKSNALPGGRNQSSESPIAILVTITKDNGEEVKSSTLLNLFDLNGQYISESLDLPSGSYLLKEFLVISEYNNVLMAAPQEGSEMAEFVDHPLPLAFSVSVDQTTEVQPEVIEIVDSHTPEQFGYATFSFSVIKIVSIPVKVTTPSLQPINAHVIYHGYNESGAVVWSSEKELSAWGSNSLFVRSASDKYSFTFSASGFESKTVEYSSLENVTSLNVVLEPSVEVQQLNINIKKVSSIEIGALDSASIHFYNFETGEEVYQSLTLNGSYATGVVNVRPADWFVRVLYFSTQSKNEKSKVITGSFSANITAGVTGIVSDGTCASLKYGNTISDCTMGVGWDFYLAYHEISKSITIMMDEENAVNGFFEVWNWGTTKIEYIYMDRYLYKLENSQHTTLASGAWECYDCNRKHIYVPNALPNLAIDLGDAHWDYADSYVLLYEDTGEEVAEWREWFNK